MKNSFLLSLALFFSVSIFAQGVKISGTSGSPDPSAILEAQSNSQGFLPPRMNTAERDAINAPAPGLIIYNTDTNCANMYIGTNWQELCGNCTPPAVQPSVITGADNAC